MEIECLEVITDTQRKKFVSLPGILYGRDTNTRNKAEELDILNHVHVLSNEFDIVPLIVVDKLTGDIKSRCIVTFYKNDDNAYFGFFDSVNNVECAELLINQATQVAKDNNKNKLVGPYDCSFWIGYRLKIDNFNEPYMCEPYNKDYYFNLLERLGFSISDNYFSNHFQVVPPGYENIKWKSRLQLMYEKEYVLKKLSVDSFDKHLRDIYRLLIKLYSSFPTFKYITEHQFCDLFKSLKYVLNYDMVKLIYKKDELQAFCVNIPNYRNYTSNLNFYNIMKILKTKIKTDEYVLLYMGVDKTALGLGGALAELTKNDLIDNGCKSIGALIHEGKVSGIYYEDLIEYKSNYVLLYKNI